jgi:hypothetical protein
MRSVPRIVGLAALAFAGTLDGVAAAQSTHSQLGPDVTPTRHPGPTVAPKFTPPSPPDGSDQNATGGLGGEQAETAVAVNPLDSDNVVGVANDWSTGNVLTAFFTTQDGGQTWTSGDLPLEPGFSFSGDPEVVFCPDGTPVIICLQYYGAGGSGIYAYRSLDHGLTWQSGVQADLNGSNDKVQAACDFSSGPHHGQICAAWDRFGTGAGDNVYTSTSDDGGKTFSTSKRIDDANASAIAPDVAYGANSELWVMWADRGRFDVMIDHSSDGGATWGTDIFVANYNQVPSPIPGSFFRMFDIFSVAADWTNGPYAGSVYVTWHTWKGSAPRNANVRCAASHDGGATWSSTVVNKGDTTDADQVFPHAVVDAKGALDIDYYDRRLDPNNYLLWTWVARSSDGGATFKEYRVSDAGWDHAATENAGYIGDYMGIDASPHEVRPFWTDGTSGSQDVVCDAVNLDFFSDVATLSAATGGVAAFTIDVGPNHGGANYWVLGSLATAPGLTFGSGVHLALDYDPFFLLTLQYANSPSFVNTRGTLDATGGALASLDTGGPFSPSFAGVDLFFATLVLLPSPVFATNPTKVTLVP